MSNLEIFEPEGQTLEAKLKLEIFAVKFRGG